MPEPILCQREFGKRLSRLKAFLAAVLASYSIRTDDSIAAWVFLLFAKKRSGSEKPLP